MGTNAQRRRNAKNVRKLDRRRTAGWKASAASRSIQIASGSMRAALLADLDRAGMRFRDGLS